ncbi:splicing factor, arginine/serine-rich 15-like [Dendronephthya gigantea]|uniref:splicing factor, arginine/serine-rich 15-like n=1 Tax=Dendronephthya gigantea TaxID=151771 RepID=UPI00106B8366|nr:splicing factor, arginine/serine-rich 15-like [Dendronephthya gigantea]
MADMEIVRQFNSELSTLYATKPPISKAKVTSITRLALKAAKYYKHVVQSLEKFVQKCRPEYKVPALYVIDSIIRQSRHQFGADKDVFGPRFGRNITNSFQNFFKCLPEEQSKLIKVLNLWQKNKVYTPEVIQPLLNMALTGPMTENQGKLNEDVKAVPADTTQPVVDHMTQHHASEESVAMETPQEQAYIALLQQQQDEQMRHIRELEARLQRQQKKSQQIQEGQPPHAPQLQGHDQGGAAKFKLPTEVFAQIQALTGMVNQPGSNPPESYRSGQYSGGEENYEQTTNRRAYEGNKRPDEYAEQQYDSQEELYPPGRYAGAKQQITNASYQQSFRPDFDEQGNNNYIAQQQHQEFVDDFDYGDDQDDQQRIEEKKRQLEEEASRLKTSSSFRQDDTINARQRMEEQFRQQQQITSNVPPQAVPETRPVPETLHPKSDSAIAAFQPSFTAPGKPARSRSRSPRERKHRDSDRENASYGDRDRDRDRGRERQTDGSERNRQRNRGEREDRERTRVDRGDRDRPREDRDRLRSDREGRDKARGDRDRAREERERPREERERQRDERERPREDRDRSRDDRERPREERERSREERGRESDKEMQIKETPSEEKKEVKNEKWIPPIKEGHVSVCSRTIWLGRMHRNTTKETLEEMFEEFGKVQIIDMIPPRGCAYIQMAEREAAYYSLSSRHILKQNYKLAWAPAKSAKDYKEHFDKELGVTYIPAAKLQESKDTVSSLSEGGWIDPRTIPEFLHKKEEASAAASSTTGAEQAPGVLGTPLGPPPFAGMPPGVPPGIPRFPLGIPGMPMPGVPPPGMNLPRLPGMPFQPGMGNMPFQRMPMNSRMPFIPGVNPFMMPGMMPPGMQQGGAVPGMPPPFFRGPPPMTGPPPTSVPADASAPQDANQTEVSGQATEGNLAAGAESGNGPPGESAPAVQGSVESSFQGNQVSQEGQGVSESQDGQQPQVPEQFGGQNVGPAGVPPFQGQVPPPFQGQGAPPFHSQGAPPFQGQGPPPFQGQGAPPYANTPQFQQPFQGQQGQPPFHGDQQYQGPPSYHEQGGGQWAAHQDAPDNQWRPEGRSWGPEGGQRNDNWGNDDGRWGSQGDQWGHQNEHWEHEDRRWGRGNDRRGRRDRRSQDDWGHDEPYDRRKRGRFDNDWGPPHDRHQGPPHDRHQGPPHDRHHGHDRHRDPPFDHRGPAHFGRDNPPRFGPQGRGLPHMDEQSSHGQPWMREEPRGRWGEDETGYRGNTMDERRGFEAEQKADGNDANGPSDGSHDAIPSLMESQVIEPPQAVEPSVGESTIEQTPASQEEVAKGWAEINELKARLAMNKNQVGAPNGAMADQAQGDIPEDSNLGSSEPEIKTERIEQSVDVGQVGASGETSGEDMSASSLQPEGSAVNLEGTPSQEEAVCVKTEPADEGISDGQSGSSGENPAEMVEPVVDKTESTDQGLGEDAGQISLSGETTFEGEAIATDEAKEIHGNVEILPEVDPSKNEPRPTVTAPETSLEEKSDITSTTAASHEKMNEGEKSIVKSDQEVEGIVSEHKTTDEASEVGETSKTVGEEKSGELGEGKEGSDGVDMGSSEINTESQLGSKVDKVESNECVMGLGEMESAIGLERDSLGLEDENVGSEMASMEMKAVSDEGEIGSVQTSISKNVSDMDTDVDNVETGETSSQKEEMEFPAEVQNMEETSAPVDSISEERGAVALADKPTELSEVSETQVSEDGEKDGVELSETLTEPGAEIPHEIDISSNVNPVVTSKLGSSTTSIDTNETVDDGREQTDEVVET